MHDKGANNYAVTRQFRKVSFRASRSSGFSGICMFIIVHGEVFLLIGNY